MILNRLIDLRPTEEHLVIINFNTRLSATLSLLSALKHAEMPVLMIDCRSTDGSFEHFSKIMKSYDFDLLSIPPDSHGIILDWVFTNIPSKKVLLMDSDAELLSSDILGTFRGFIDDERTFGCGFVQSPGSIPNPPDGYYEERLWTSFVLLKTCLVRDAILEGHSFVAKTLFNDFAASQFLSRILRIRYHLPIFKNPRLSWLDPFRRSYHGYKPSYVIFDTGADLYHHLKYQERYLFVGFPEYFSARYVAHIGGLTRLLLTPKDKIASGYFPKYILASSLQSIQDAVLKRLKESYDFSPAD